jgi:hypothetical protein
MNRTTHCEACNRSYKQIKPHLKTKKHQKNALLLQQNGGDEVDNLVEQMDNLNIEEQCSICLENISENQHSTECGHHFHKDCIGNWRRMKNNCPNCRHQLPPLQPVLPPQFFDFHRRRQHPRQRRYIRGYIREPIMVRRPISMFERQQSIFNHNLVDILLRTISILETFDNGDPTALQNARDRLMQELNR